MIQHMQSSTQKVEALCHRLDANVRRLERLEQRVLPEESHRGQPESFHTTGPHNLIRLWPTVKYLLDRAQVYISDDYVLRAEEGASFNRLEGCRTRPITSGLHSENAFHLKAPTDRSRLVLLDEPMKASLFQCYVRHMHILHPFLDLRVAHDASLALNIQSKRPVTGSIYNRFIHSPVQSGMQSNTPTRTSSSSPGEQQASDSKHPLHDAIILLIFAIGAMCSEKARKPSQDQIHATSTSVRHAADLPERVEGSRRGDEDRVKTSPSGLSPSPTLASSSLTPDDNWSWPLSCPGSACYLHAARLIDSGGEYNDLISVHVYLLGALYKSQSGEVYEALAWLNKASRICQILLTQHDLLQPFHESGVPRSERDLQAMQSRVKEDVDNRVLVASWTTLQLESDILAELPLSPSALRAHEDDIPWPVHMPDADLYQCLTDTTPLCDLPTASDILIAYTAQLWLRRRLNHTQRSLYGNVMFPLSTTTLCETLQGQQNDLRGWRERLPDSFQWKDEDPPSPDILCARLRAKYYGASYITLRPFLDFALHVAPGLRDGLDLASSAVAADGSRRSNAELQIFRAILTLPDVNRWRAAKDCVQAAVQSTCAFDGILSKHQLIVTNIHGTAHA